MNAVWTLVWLVLGAATGCSTFEGLTEAQRDGGKVRTVCKPARVPPRSTLVSIEGENEFVVAFRSVDMSSEDGAVGFDLDGTCTGQGDGPSCVRPPWADEHDDGPGGRDNSVPASYTIPDSGAGAVTNQVNSLINDGRLTTALRVRGYNISPNDFEVEVELFGVTRGSGYLNIEPNPPEWEGGPVSWNPMRDWVEETAPGSAIRSAFRSDRAYVTDGVLVAHFDKTLGAPNFRFSNVYIVARLVRHEDTWILTDGVFTGRLKVDLMVAGLGYLPDPTFETLTRFCTNTAGYAAAKLTTCALADIRYDDDDASRPCDAASWAYRFDTASVTLSDQVNEVLLKDYPYCADLDASPADDRCGSP